MKFRIDVTVEVSLPCDGKSAVVEAAKMREAVEFEVLGLFYGRETATRTLVRVTPDEKKVVAEAGFEPAASEL